MLGNLFASLMFAVSCGTPLVPKKNNVDQTITEHRNVIIDNSFGNTGSTGYVIKNWNDVDTPFFTGKLFDHDVIITLNINDYDFSPVWATWYYTPAFDNYDLKPCTEFMLAYYHTDNPRSSDFIEIEYNCGGTVGNFYFDGTIDEDHTYELFSTRYNYIDVSKMAIYFVNNVVFNEDESLLFRTVFTREYNDNFRYYTGWYNMELNYLTGQHYISLPGLFFYNNAKFNSMYLIEDYVQGTSMMYQWYFVDYRLEMPKWTYYAYQLTEGWTNGVKNVQMSNVFMPVSTYNNMLLFGSFQYVIPDEDYSLDDLFVSIADTPIIFISGLLNFEIFGMSLYSAVLGIITIIVMIFILKKVL